MHSASNLLTHFTQLKPCVPKSSFNTCTEKGNPARRGARAHATMATNQIQWVSLMKAQPQKWAGPLGCAGGSSRPALTCPQVAWQQERARAAHNVHAGNMRSLQRQPCAGRAFPKDDAKPLTLTPTMRLHVCPPAKRAGRPGASRRRAAATHSSSTMQFGEAESALLDKQALSAAGRGAAK